jgi:hypothetical protein
MSLRSSELRWLHKVFHDRKHPSHVLLLVIPEEGWHRQEARGRTAKLSNGAGVQNIR